MKNGNEGYTGSPNKKTGIGSMISKLTFPQDDIVQFRSILFYRLKNSKAPQVINAS